jgi:hypothetical protein
MCELRRKHPGGGGNFSPERLEKLLNEQAAEGWRLVSSYQTQSVWKTFKADIILILERTN